MLLLVGELALIYFGYLITLFLFKRIHLLQRLAYSFLFGTALYSLALFGFSIFKGRITTINVFAILSILIAFLQLLVFIKKVKLENWEKSFIHGFRKLNKVEIYLLIIFLLLFLGSLVLATYWPVYEWDALALYDFRGRVIAQTGELLGTIGKTEYFSHYPPATSILHAFVYLLGGKNPQYIYPFYYLSFLFVFYFQLLRISNRKTSLFVTLILASTPIFFTHSTFAYTNLPYAIYFFIGTIYAYLFIVENKISYLLVAAISTGLTTWMRGFEPFWASNLVFLVSVYFLKRDFKKLHIYALYPLIFFPIQQLWSVYLEKFLGKWYSAVGVISRGISTVFTKLSLAKIISISMYIYYNIILPWGVLSLLFLAIAAREVAQIKKDNRKYLLLIITINLAALIGGTYFFSLTVKDWDKIPDSARRMAMIFTPLLIYYIGGSKYMKEVVKIFDRIFS